MIQIRVRRDAAQKVRGFFPWIYKPEVLIYKKTPQKGDIVVVRDTEGKFLGYGYANLDTNIAVRIVSFDKDEKFTKELVYQRIQNAFEYRKSLNLQSNAYRLIHSEADFLPGVMIDVYGDYVVVEYTAYGMYKLRQWVEEALVEVLKPAGIYQKGNEFACASEGFQLEEKCVYGDVPDEITIWEHDLKFIVNVKQGQKTGFYLDQRAARRIIRGLVKEGDRGLDVFCHSGGFALNMLKAGASQVIAVDISARALQLGKKNLALNNLQNVEWVEEDAFDFMRRLYKKGERFDIVVIDPPSFAKNKAAIPNAMRGYTELCVRGIHLTRPGGYMAVYSCSHHVTRRILIEVITKAAKDTRRQLRVIGESFQDLDHPWLIHVPNTLYLKGIYVQVV